MDFFLAGILSSIDVLTNDRMENIVHSLALSGEVTEALLGRPGIIRECLDCIQEYEKFEFDTVRLKLAPMNLTLNQFMNRYMEALTWLKTTDG